jgi:pyruvate dehydrogenase E1 component alpha subunit
METAVKVKDPASAPINAKLTKEEKTGFLREMLRIRRFEQQALKQYNGGKMGGFLHLYIGQESVAVGTCSLMGDHDHVITAYRDHGHALAVGMTMNECMAELYGKATGCSKGKGGSMHLFDASVGNMGGHGIVGGQIPLGTGFAFSCWYKKTGGVCFTLFGDGAINQGAHNEALNLGSLFKLPCIYIVENNLMAMGTQVERHSAETDLAKRALGYNMPTTNVDGNDLDVVIDELTTAVNRGREGKGPSYLVMNTYRYRGHSMSDAMKYRTK